MKEIIKYLIICKESIANYNKIVSDKMSFWEGKKVLVTGASGFTGSHLCRELVRNGAEVKALVRKNSKLDKLPDIKQKIQLAIGDVTNIQSIMKVMKNVEIVFHTAAIVPTIENREQQKIFEVNTLGTFNVAAAAKEHNIENFLYTSTGHVYGIQPKNKIPFTEKIIPNPVDLYSISKYAGEISLRSFIKDGLNIVITRSFTKFGPFQTGSYLVPKVIREVLRGESPKIVNPNHTRDYFYIKDAIAGYMLAVERGKPGEIYNFCSGKETKVKDMCNKIIEVCKSKVKVTYNTNIKSKDITRSFGDYSKAKRELGWKPKINLDTGLKFTLEWWRENPNLLK